MCLDLMIFAWKARNKTVVLVASEALREFLWKSSLEMSFQE